MIVSHKYRFIFVHIPKKAGSSVTVSPCRYLGSREIAVSCWHDAFQYGVSPNAKSSWWALRPPGCKTLLTALIRRRGISQAFNRAVKATAGGHFQIHSSIFPHVTAREIKQRFPEQWRRYFSFCFVRTRYDRVASESFWRLKQVGRGPTFSEYLRALERGLRLRFPRLPTEARVFYSDQNGVLVDRICRYEHLSYDLQSVLAEVGTSGTAGYPMPRPALLALNIENRTVPKR